MKTKKKVDLLSPQPKNQKEKEKEKEKEKDNKPTEKEPPVTTVVLKVSLHCQGCIDRITKIVYKTKGVHNMSIEKEKDTISVKGIMDVKALVEDLINKLKRKVEVVPPKKEKSNDKEGEVGGGGGGDKEGGGKKKNKGSGGGGGGGGGGGEMEKGKMEYLAPPAFAFAYPYPYANVGGVNYAPFYPENYQLQAPAPQIFSDENPNACSVM
ncbi:putative heavy metal-associated domain, HMA [Lupinus albus]|uniref:Putative heavy metal-associated domain, HMA n=1 Tax=Lupinus albus TaxID=3870 RepID=A0A6A4R5G8_LUPAL|nr:putative heavy metal-associated domain, HMA [Lupinus albus]